MSTSHGVTHDHGQTKKATASGWIGSALEYYDFFIFASASALIFPQIFFPSGDDAAFHQIDKERAEPDFHHMGAHADDHRLAVAMGFGNGLRDFAQRLDRQDIGERIEKPGTSDPWSRPWQSWRPAPCCVGAGADRSSGATHRSAG